MDFAKLPADLRAMFDKAVAQASKPAATSFLEYCKVVYEDFEAPPHVKLIAETLERVERGELRRVIINAPPRHGKSVLASVLFPAWYMGRNPKQGIICASHAQALASDFGRDVRNLISSEAHRSVFPNSRISEDSAAANKFRTEANGPYFAVGIGTTLTGRGGKLLCIDDPVKNAEEAYSEIIQRRNEKWFSTVAFSRLAPQGAIVVTGARWHPSDLIGWLLTEHAHLKWHVINLPAVAEEDDVLGRAVGAALWRNRYDEVELAEMKIVQGTDWWPLYQQRPRNAEGAIFRESWFNEFETPPAPEEIQRVVQSWDTAFKTGEENDYSVCTTWALTTTGYYLLHVFRERMEFPALLAAAKMLAREWAPHVILIEDKASGTSLGQQLLAQTALPVFPVKALTDKKARANAATPIWQAGKIFVRKGAAWLEWYKDEMCSFPAGKHDDSVDSTTQACEYFRLNPAWDGEMPDDDGYELDKKPFGGTSRGHWRRERPDQKPWSEVVPN